MTQNEIKALIEDLRLNHEFCPKEVILQAADELERMQQGAAMKNARELGLTYATQPTEAERLAKFSEQHNEKMRLYRFAGSGDGELAD
jgi:hypothetical protein